MNCFKVYSFIAVNYHYTSRIRHVGISPYLFSMSYSTCSTVWGTASTVPLQVAVAPVSRSVLFDVLPVKSGILGGMSSLACVPLSLKIIARKYYNLVVANMNYVMTRIYVKILS